VSTANPVSLGGAGLHAPAVDGMTQRGPMGHGRRTAGLRTCLAPGGMATLAWPCQPFRASVLMATQAWPCHPGNGAVSLNTYGLRTRRATCRRASGFSTGFPLGGHGVETIFFRSSAARNCLSRDWFGVFAPRERGLNKKIGLFPTNRVATMAVSADGDSAGSSARPESGGHAFFVGNLVLLCQVAADPGKW